MIDKIAASVADALAGVKDGSTVLIGGFGGAGQFTQGRDRSGADRRFGAANGRGDGPGGTRPRCTQRGVPSFTSRS